MKFLARFRDWFRKEEEAALWELARKYWSEEEDNEGQAIFYTGEYPNGKAEEA